MKRRNVDDGQLWLFDIPDRRKRVRHDDLPHYPEPKDDNERLFECQYRYRNGHPEALSELFTLSCKICVKIINQIVRNKKIGRMYTRMQREEKATVAAEYIPERLLRNDGFAVRTSFTGYLYLRCKYELFHRRKVDGIVDFVDMDDFYRITERDLYGDDPEN